jgi:acetyl esterase/lipase
MRVSVIKTAHWKILAFLVQFLLLVCLAACGGSASNASQPSTSLSHQATPSPEHFQVTTYFDIHYGPLPDEILDLCLPTNATTPRPGIIVIHGGGWTGGGKGTYDGVCSYLASQGFVAATINYRLAPAHFWPAQLIDAQLAVRWLRSKAHLIRLDPQRICSFGTSAGAHLAIFLGVLASIHEGDEAGVLATESPGVSCVVDEFGPTDLTAPLNTAYQRSILSALLDGATLQSNPTIYRDASPIFDVSPHSAAMLIVQGNSDNVVPPSQSQELQNKLQQAQVPVQYIGYVGGHGLSGLTQEQKDTIQTQVVAFLIAQEHP